ncbi:MAG: hypothetical protein JJT76_01515 [Clostridiaceae bacterium]|nr:hypothetical protein [Clostridiaceae bacterium]
MNDKKNSNKDNSGCDYTSLGIPFGLIIGTILGLKFNNIAIGPGIGMLLGIFIGFLIDYNKNDINKMYLIKIIKIVLITVIGVILISLTPKIVSFLW